MPPKAQFAGPDSRTALVVVGAVALGVLSGLALLVLLLTFGRGVPSVAGYS